MDDCGTRIFVAPSSLAFCLQIEILHTEFENINGQERSSSLNITIDYARIES